MTDVSRHAFGLAGAWCSGCGAMSERRQPGTTPARWGRDAGGQGRYFCPSCRDQAGSVPAETLRLGVIVDGREIVGLDWREAARRVHVHFDDRTWRGYRFDDLVDVN